MKRVVGFSGGADSQATALWARRIWPAEDVILMNSDAGGNEHPLTSEFVRWYSHNIFPVVEVQTLVKDLGDIGTRAGATGDRRRSLDEEAPLTFDRLAFVKGRFPSRKVQFCTEYLKLAPQLRWLKENLVAHGIPFARYVGVRRDESNLRSKCPDSKWDDYFGCTVYYPIADWTKEQVFAYLQEAGEDVNPLYKLGFGRVGCAPCINSGKEDIRLWASRFPEVIDKVREWEKSVGRTFFHAMLPGRRTSEGGTGINWIDEVVEWAKTERGGKQYSLPFVEAEVESGRCMSKYGLCE